MVVLSSPINLSHVDKLEALRRLDQFRPWHSLDEKRFCLVCGKIITGEQIQVIGGMRGTGPLRIICPTPNCHSIPMDWVLPTDEVLADIALREAQRPRPSRVWPHAGASTLKPRAVATRVAWTTPHGW